MDHNKKRPEIDGLDTTDRDKALKKDLNMEVNINNLAFNAEKNSYEMDVEGSDPDYQHPDPYDTSAENGADFNSDYDEANPTVGDEYDKEVDLEEDLDKMGMHVDSGKITKLSSIDEELAKTPEDDRDDLDEEGYPKNDQTRDVD